MSSGAPSPSSRVSKPQRVLACTLCQQRKVKCDRKFPCANCTKFRAHCVQATLAPRPRKHGLVEQALVKRLRDHEDLLRQNNIAFQDSAENESLNAESGYDSNDEHPEISGPDSSTLSIPLKSGRGFETRNSRHATSQGFPDPDNDSDSSHENVRETMVREARNRSVANNDHILFGLRRTTVNLSSLHPDPVQIFRLWQIYVDNVNPLLKVTHTPSLQGRIIEAASNMKSINPTLEAVMFSIYCTSILSTSAGDCQNIFGSSKEDLLMKYQFGCQQALLNCGVLQSSDRDCLTALYLYLLSVRPKTSPQSLSSMLGVAIRIAQRMAIHSESALAKCSPLEAEMRRRLWWSLVLFDTRIGEIASSKTVTLDPTWDCKIPLNVNDSDLRQGMKEPPAIQGISTEALFVVVRSELGEFIRHTEYHLNFTSPALKLIAKHVQNGSGSEGTELVILEEMIENRYLKFCDQENPIHFMTIWTTRAYLAKCRLLEHHSRYSNSSQSRTEAERDAATSHALKMLECDTELMTSPLTKGFLWLNHFYFPFPAYIQIVQDLRTRPYNKQSRQAWERMGDNYDAWFDSQFREDSPFFQIFTKIILQAWEAYEAAFEQSGETLSLPKIVSSIRETLAHVTRNTRIADKERPSVTFGVGSSSISTPTPHSVESLDDDAIIKPEIYFGNPGQAPSDDMHQLDWTVLGGWPNWGGC